MKTNQIIVASLVGLTTCSSLVLASIHTYADNDTAVDEVEITVPVSCTMTGTINTNHTATLTPGTYSGTSTDYANGIGKTTLTTFCNDNNGFSIYAIGFTGDAEGTNTLVGANTGATIATKAYEPTDTTSNWSMKVTKVTDTSETYNPNNMTITNSYDSWHAVPDDYTKVAEYKSTTEPATTDTTLGAKVETTYATYVATNQPADTYTGKVKYVMVHPYDAEKPIIPTSIADATYMQEVNTCPEAITTGQVYTLKDSRDEREYNVAKLADGNCWLLDNLALDLTNSTVLNGMTQDNTNASNTTLGYLKNGGGTTSDQYATAAVANWTTSFSYSAPLVNLAYKDTVPTDAISAAGGYKVGGYYNYCAASAGSYCYGDGTGQGTTSGNATEDICPKGWRMPSGGSTIDFTIIPPTGEYKNLYDNYSYNNYTAYREALHLPLSGTTMGSSPYDQSSYGRFWSSTRSSNGTMYGIELTSAGISINATLPLQKGYSLRCVLK